jgi:hypothetical protein
MPLRPRRTQIDRHVNLANRVRALEVGAHPMSAGLDFGASFPLTLIGVLSGWSNTYTIGATTYFARYRKRLSTVQFYNGPQGDLGSVPAGGVQIGSISQECAPGSDMTFSVAIQVDPFWMRLVVKSNGQLWLYNPGGATGTGQRVYFDNVNFVAEDAGA